MGHQFSSIDASGPVVLKMYGRMNKIFDFLFGRQIEIVDRKQKAVVHYLEAFQNTAVSFDSLNQCVVCIRFQTDSFRMYFQEIQILESGDGFTPFFS